MAKYKPYEKYKDSGIEWIGQVPEHWGETKIKHIAKINKRALPESTPNDYIIDYVDIGSVTPEGKVNSVQTVTFEKSPSRARRIILDGDTIVSTVRTYLKAITWFDSPPKNLICSTGFAVLSPTDSISPKFLFRLMQSEPYINEIVSRSTGVSYPAINASEIGQFLCYLPLLEEQQAIANFLDQKTSEIDALIADKEKLIKILQEYRQSVISEAVTKGLNPDVKMKDSGVEWIGQVPEHWKSRKLKHVMKLVYRYPTYYGISYQSTGVLEIRGEMLSEDGTICTKSCEPRYISEETASKFPRTKLEVDDIVMSVRGTMGKVGIVTLKEEGSNITANLLRLSPDTNAIYSQWLIKVLRSFNFHQELDNCCDKTTIQTVRVPKLLDIYIPFPSLGEQQAIANFLDQKTFEIDDLIADIRNSIDSLKHYRQSLISEAVTGKIDVRGYDSEGH
ncbi:MAG: restriction endonuclease subunit S [Firmicutes bacterium]|nr:restriction endonuclease subunit S [Bacillota bacterium]